VFAAETYDLIFKAGTLADVSKEDGLEYGREVSLAADAELGARNTGTIRLSFGAEEMAHLKFEKGDKYRNVGAFPATVGNPIIMYFVETVLRDVAQQAGGSPFYIRNRIKESLVQVTEINDVAVSLEGEVVEARQITLRPFENDKNRDRMKGYGDLTMTFTMSEDIPGWYQSLVARVVGTDAETPLYENALVLQGSGISQ
jgi:hypothetical protein